MMLTTEQRLTLAALCFEKAGRLREAGKNEPKFLIPMEDKAQGFEYLGYRLLQGF